MNSCFWTDIVAAEQSCAGAPGPGPGPEGITMYAGLPGYSEPVVYVEGLGLFTADYSTINSSVVGWGNINHTGLYGHTLAAAGGRLLAANIAYSSTPQSALLVSSDGVTLTRYDGVVPVPVQYSSTLFFLYHPVRDKLYWAVSTSSFYRPPGDPDFKVYEADPNTPWTWTLFQDVYLPAGAHAGYDMVTYIHGTGEILQLVSHSAASGGGNSVLVLGATGGFTMVTLNIDGGTGAGLTSQRLGYAAGSGMYLLARTTNDGYETLVSPTLGGTFVSAGSGASPGATDLYRGWAEVPGTPYAFAYRNPPDGGCDWDTPGAGILTTDGATIAAEITTATHVDYWDGEDWEEELYGYVGVVRSAIQLGPNEWAIYARLHQGCG